MHLLLPTEIILSFNAIMHPTGTSLIKAAEEWRLKNSADSQLVLCIGS